MAMIYRTKSIIQHADGRSETTYKEHTVNWPDQAIRQFARAHPDAVVSITAVSAPPDRAKRNAVTAPTLLPPVVTAPAYDLASMITEAARRA